MEYLEANPSSLAKAAQVLRSGGLVAFPTETVYGLGADAFNAEALAKIFEAKQRPRFDPLIIHIASMEMLENVTDISLLDNKTKRRLFLLAENFWPGPLSLVLPKNKKIPDIATSGLSTAAIRFPANKIAQDLISLSGTAVAAPSANPFGSLSPTKAEHVRSGLGDKVDIILDGGSAQIGVESTVLDLSNDKIKILRPGGTPKEAIEKLLGHQIEVFNEKNDDNNETFSSPGQLKSHYAPRTPLLLFNIDEISSLEHQQDAAFLFFDDASYYKWQEIHGEKTENAVIKVLSPDGNLNFAASRLFETLHELDSLQISRIYAQLVPENGLGIAINDRLRRGSCIKNLTQRRNGAEEEKKKGI